MKYALSVAFSPVAKSSTQKLLRILSANSGSLCTYISKLCLSVALSKHGDEFTPNRTLQNRYTARFKLFRKMSSTRRNAL